MNAYQRKRGLKKPEGIIHGSLREQDYQYYLKEADLPTSFQFPWLRGNAGEIYEECED